MLRRYATAATPFAWKDVHYTGMRHPKQTLDIAIPADRFPRHKLPTCIFVHGGAWQRGDKAGFLNNGIDQVFAREGWIGVSLNYRLSPEVQYPEHAKDIAAAVAWIHNNIEKYGGDPNSLVLIGHSAGAHLVMQIMADPAFLPPKDALDTNVSFGQSIKAVVGISGVYNVVRLANSRLYGSLTVHPAFGEHVGQWREGSVISTLASQKAISPLYKTPTLLINAADDFHFEQDAIDLEAWLKEGGNSMVEREVIAERNHFSILRDLTVNPEDQTMGSIRSFLHRVKCCDN